MMEYRTGAIYSMKLAIDNDWNRNTGDNLVIAVESELSRAALRRPASRAIQVVSYTEDYVVSLCNWNKVKEGIYQVDRRSNHGKRHCP